jgi:hypothetical protein
MHWSQPKPQNSSPPFTVSNIASHGAHHFFLSLLLSGVRPTALGSTCEAATPRGIMRLCGRFWVLEAANASYFARPAGATHAQMTYAFPDEGPTAVNLRAKKQCRSHHHCAACQSTVSASRHQKRNLYGRIYSFEGRATGLINPPRRGWTSSPPRGAPLLSPRLSTHSI